MHGAAMQGRARGGAAGTSAQGGGNEHVVEPASEGAPLPALSARSRERWQCDHCRAVAQETERRAGGVGVRVERDGTVVEGRKGAGRRRKSQAN